MMDEDKRCFTYCGDDRCNCPARSFAARVEHLEFLLRHLASPPPQRPSQLRFGTLAEKRISQRKENARRVRRITDSGGIAGISLPDGSF